ncbi:type 1 glutamine amidotransferase family protein [Planococcus salinus]|uniref:Glutamine amidotransferase n=1 Tax=Planococcus salinus TaxID=1848460 RepID=A0A3M8P5L5_9BACL|nr:type 1 glutamine amidotransferase family protein [Planococcus salinus]RNF38967.1 glutamine amidotransferase [Planococcus salinus]
MEEVLFVILDEYADWEAASLAAALNEKPETAERKYIVKTVSLSKEPVTSIGGFNVLPDYSIDEVPDRFSGLVLIGGNSWRNDDSQRVMELVNKALERKAVIGAICDATVFLGKNGLLNDVEHTSNQLEDLKEAAGSHYSGEQHYRHQQAVRSSRLVTANGTAFLEFGKEMLEALEAAPQPEIDEWYAVYKQGYHEFMKSLADGQG